MRSTRHTYYNICDRRNRRHTSGSALIALIAAILIFSVLAAALLPMVSSSGEQAVLSNLGDKAYLLAESGYRYMKSNYDSAPTETGKIDILDAMDSDHDDNFTLSDGQSRFNLGIFSYFLSIPAGTYAAGSSISANPPGRLPIIVDLHDDNVTITNQQLLSIDGAIYRMVPSNPPSAEDEADDNVTFSLVTELLAQPQAVELPSRTDAYPAARTNQGTLEIGQNLSYQTGQGVMFPLRNGRINVQGHPNPLSYHYNNRAANRFEDVRDPNDNTISSIFLPAGSSIVLNKTIRVRSTGIVGGGGLETRRQLDYYISGEPGESEEVSVALEDLQATDADTTTTAVTSIGGNDALAITASVNNASLLQLRGTVTDVPLRRARRRSGGYLSYDAQAKLGFLSALPVAAGLSFRLNNSENPIASDITYNGYGLSFMRANNADSPDTIFSKIVPTGLDDQPLMVLWQQTDAGINWLAYKELQPCIYPEPPDRFDDVIGAWISTNASWIIANTGRNGSQTWHYVDNDIAATLQSPLIFLNDPSPSTPACDGAPRITLTFWCRERWPLADSPFRAAYISYSGGAFSPFTPTRGTIQDGWYPYTYDLSSRNGQTIRIQLVVSPSPGASIQWDIDDVKVLYERCPWPVQNSTLLVRLREAAVVPFDQGGPVPIREGDWIYGATSGTRGRVLQPPLLTSTNWGANAAAGTLLLNRLSVNPSGFQPNEDLLVVGRTGGIGARVVSYSDATDRKVNTIKVFYGSQGGSGAASGDSLDPDTLPYPRREDTDPFRWPPDEDDNWTAEEDFFRLVQWDVINPDPGLDLEALTYIDDDNRTVENAVIRSYDPDLQSPPLGLPISTELGLHAYGEGADNVYFDDFGLRLFFGTSSLFDTVLQQ